MSKSELSTAKQHNSREKRTPLQKQIASVLAAGGFVVWDQNVELRRGSLVCVESFDLRDSSNTVLRRLKRATVEECARIGVLGIKKLVAPEASFIMRIGPHKDSPLRQVPIGARW